MYILGAFSNAIASIQCNLLGTSAAVWTDQHNHILEQTHRQQCRQYRNYASQMTYKKSALQIKWRLKNADGLPKMSNKFVKTNVTI